MKRGETPGLLKKKGRGINVSIMEPGINRGDEKIRDNIKLSHTFKNAYGLKKQISSPSTKYY